MILTGVTLLLTLPPAAYLAVTLIEWATGTDGGGGVFGTAFDGWSDLSLVILVVGSPLLALALIGQSSLRLRSASRNENAVAATIDFRMSRGRLRLAVVSLLLTIGVIAYWFNKNWPCLYDDQWLC